MKGAGAGALAPAPVPLAHGPMGLLGVIALSTHAATPEAQTGDATQDSGLRTQDLRAALEAAIAAGAEVEITFVQTGASALDATAPRMQTRSERAALGYDLALPRWPLPWGGESSGGGAALSAKLLGGGGFNVLHALGAITFVGALIPLLRTPRRFGAAACFAGVGLALIAVGTVHERYPWALALAALALAGLLAWCGYEAWRRGRLDMTVSRVTRAVEVSGADEVKDAVLAMTTERERRAMDAEIDRHKGGRSAGRRGRRADGTARTGREAGAGPNGQMANG